jgi:hypothetical protein
MAASLAACWLAMTVVGAAEPAQQQADAKAAAADGKAGNKASEKTSSKAAESKATNNKAGDKQQEQQCAVTTGSRIRRDPARVCAPGERSFTADEIAATGEMNTSEALRKLDPRFQ